MRTAPTRTAPLAVDPPGVLGNDSDVDGDALQALLLIEPSHGTLTLNVEGTFEYLPEQGYLGGDSYTYQVCDPQQLCDESAVTISVIPSSGELIVVDDLYSTYEEAPLTIGLPGVLGNDVADGGDILTVEGFSQPDNGIVSVNPDGSFTYTPASEFVGWDDFTYTILDADGGSATATVYIDVMPENLPPVAGNDSATVIGEVSVDIPVLANDADPDGDPLTVKLVLEPEHGSAAPNSDGTITYSPDAGYCGSDVFEYMVSDGSEGDETATVSLTVVCPPEESSCIRSSEYWLTHSEYGPFSSDPTWAKMPDGADRSYFRSGMSYFEVLSTSVDGNAWYALAHAHIAAQLNWLGGSDHAAIIQAYDHAVYLLSTYDNTATIEGDAQEDFLNTATELDSYNAEIASSSCEDGINEDDQDDVDHIEDIASP